MHLLEGRACTWIFCLVVFVVNIVVIKIKLIDSVVVSFNTLLSLFPPLITPFFYNYFRTRLNGTFYVKWLVI